MRKVLHIDDETDIREIVSFAFDLAGEFDLLQAPDGNEGLLIARNWLPDLILLDFMMPELNGVDVIRQLKKSPDTADIPVVFMTARTTADEEESMLSLGAVAVIKKPFDPLQLPHEVQQYFALAGSEPLCA